MTKDDLDDFIDADGRVAFTGERRWRRYRLVAREPNVQGVGELS